MPEDSNSFKTIFKYDRTNHPIYLSQFRTKVCEDFTFNRCAFTKKSCFQTHAKIPARRVDPSLRENFGIFYSRTPCRHMASRGVCPLKSKCKFAHSQLEVDFHPSRYKTKICNQNINPMTGVCSKGGAHCPQAHGADDIQYALMAKINSTKNKKQPEPVGPEEYLTEAPKDSDKFLRWFKVNRCKFSESDCPNLAECGYYHNDIEKRRNPFRLAYNFQKCIFSPLNGSGSKCNAGDNCLFSHTNNEAIYHPAIYKMLPCHNHTTPSAPHCPLGSVCSQAHGDSDQRFKRDSPASPHPLSPSEMRRVLGPAASSSPPQTASLDAVDFSAVDFDLSAIPPTADGESPDISALRRELSALLNDCQRLSVEFKKYHFAMVDTVMERVAAESENLLAFEGGEVAHLESLAKEKLAEYEALNARVKCPICLCNERNTVLDGCGHFFCSSCVADHFAKRCLVCKKKYSGVQALKVNF